jgi:hypothetical protein
MSLYTTIISNCSGVARDYLSKNYFCVKNGWELASPSGFSNHQGGHLLWFDLPHIVFNTAFIAWINPYIVVYMIHWIMRLEPSFQKSLYQLFHIHTLICV